MICLNDFPENIVLPDENIKKTEKKALRFLGTAAGICVIAYVILQNVCVLPVRIPAVLELYQSSNIFRSVLNIVLSVVGFLPPFAIFFFFFLKNGFMTAKAFYPPKRIGFAVITAMAGFFCCLIGNFVSGYLTSFIESFGVELSSPEMSTPDGIKGRIVYAFTVAVVPAFIEEFAMRGVILQPLRKYGDWFAIVMSSFVFAILHGNLIQAPFALMAGIAIGYAVCVTNSIWTGVLIHFMNNLFSVVTDFLCADITDQNQLNRVFVMIEIILLCIGACAAVLFFILRRSLRLRSRDSVLKLREKIFCYIINIPMLIAIAIMLAITAQYVGVV